MQGDTGLQGQHSNYIGHPVKPASYKHVRLNRVRLGWRGWVREAVREWRGQA